MLCLSCRQPLASLLAHGWLSTSSRWFTTEYRGPVAVHASRGLGSHQRDLYKITAVRAAIRELTGTVLLDDLPRGAVVGVATLFDVTPIEELFQGGAIPPRDAAVLPRIAEGYLLRFRDQAPLAEPAPCPAEKDLFPVPARALKDILRQITSSQALCGRPG